MKEKNITFRSGCPISTALDIFGDKWSLLIIRDLVFKGLNTYGDFLKGEEKIATNILADRLVLLEVAGIITKQKHPENKVKNLYALTEKGIDLVPALVEIIVWSEKHYKVHPYARQFVKLLKQNKEETVKGIISSLRKPVE